MNQDKEEDKEEGIKEHQQEAKGRKKSGAIYKKDNTRYTIK